MRVVVVCVFVVVFFVCSCATPKAIGADPNLSEEERVALLLRLQRPSHVVDARYIENMVAMDVPLPPARYCALLDTVPLEKILPATERIPKVQKTTVLRGTWGQPTARRIVLLEDGGSAVEEVVENACPGHFRYVVWNYSSAVAALVDHGVGHFEVTGDEHNTHVVWTYSFLPKPGIGSLFLEGFIHGEWNEWMKQVLAAMKTAVIEADRKASTPDSLAEEEDPA